MVICFNASAETREQLDKLVAGGAYRDYGEVIAAAVRNQVLLEQAVAERGSIVVGDSQSSVVPPASVPPVPEKEATPDPKKTPTPTEHVTKVTPKPIPPRKLVTGTAVSKAASARPKESALEEPPNIPAAFRLDGLPEADAAAFAELPPDRWTLGQSVPLDRWVLGQQNRLLPAKVNARALIRLFAETGKALPISKTGEQIAADAALFGDYLVALDARRENGRDDLLATAFPTTGEDADKGRVRYANQFVAYSNQRGELSGLMTDLKLINIVTVKKERCIVPTKVAWAFAWMTNPVLDTKDTDTSSGAKFSADERTFLTQHIAKSVPAEAFAYRAILEAVGAGHATPDALDTVLKKYVAADRVEKLSQSFLASQRSGAVSRMSDLNLIERQREGIRVSYAITDEGLAFLELCTATPK